MNALYVFLTALVGTGVGVAGTLGVQRWLPELLLGRRAQVKTFCYDAFCVDAGHDHSGRTGARPSGAGRGR